MTQFDPNTGQPISQGAQPNQPAHNQIAAQNTPPIRSFELNIEEAREGDSGGNRIEETKDYEGVFTQAKAVVSDKGTEGIELNFKAKDGREASWLTLWTYNYKGEAIYGSKQLSAILLCMKVRSIAGVPGMVKEWSDLEAKQVEVQGIIYPEMINMPVGLVLQKELYTKTANGQDGERMQMYSFFRAGTRQTASEIIDKVEQAKAVDEMLRTLKDRDNRKPVHGDQSALAQSYQDTGAQYNPSNPNSIPPTPGSTDGFDDDPWA